ncbi:MAG: sulfatase-like hydrolase/transferase, partial [Planctomycetaceae bacterium]|nr:sulfatase-like hydrolase/transferase [Planctomycetaceae bacterium]
WLPGPDGQPVMKGKARAASNFDTIAPGLTLNAWVQQMNECMLAVDEGVGRLMTTLQETGQFENTLVIYVADQGYGLGEHGFNQKVAPYDATIASPLILARPDVIPTGKVCKQPVNAPDLMHYVCQSAQVNIPWGTHGRDISPLIQEPDKANWDSPMLFTHTARMYGNDTSVIPTDPEHLSPASNTPWYVMLRDGQYKYIRNLTPGETEELYDLAADPEELRNLAFVADQRARLERLRSLAIAELRRTGAGFVDTMPVTRQMQAK